MPLIPDFELGLWNAWIFMLLTFLVRGLGFVINREAMKRFTVTPSVEYSKTEKTVGRIYPWLGIVFVSYSIFLPLKLALTTSRA